MTIIYRAPRSDEAEALGQLGYDSFVETFGPLYAPEDLALFAEQTYALDVVAAELADPAFRHLVAEDDGRMVGYCKIGFKRSLDYEPDNHRIVELKQLYIFKSHHGTGIAQQLTNWAVEEAHAAGAEALLLSVYNDNPRGQAFYRKMGFEHVADTFFMVGNQRDDEYLFLRPL